MPDKPHIVIFNPDQWRGDALGHVGHPAVRTPNIKYVRRAFESDEFYDLAEDPGETRNLINEPSYRDHVLRLKERMLAWYMETCDVVPLDTDRRNSSQRAAGR